MSFENFDLSAAAWRSSGASLEAYLEALTTRLDSALPGVVSISRRVSLFSKRKPVKTLSIKLGDQEFNLAYNKSSGIQTRIGNVVRGITLKTENVNFPDWLKRFDAAIAIYAAQFSQTENVLEDFLM